MEARNLFIIWSLLVVPVVSRPQLNELSILSDCCSTHLGGEHYSTQCLNTINYRDEEVCGPRLRVGIVSYMTDSIMNYGKYSLFINAVYGAYNGYTVRVNSINTTSRTPDSDPRWNKISTLIDALDPVSGWARYFDYLLWVDADLIFLDFHVRIEQIAAAHPLAHILLCSELHGLNRMNSGSILVKNTAWARNFLLDWWYFGDHAHYTDQTQFDMLYESRSQELKKRIQFLYPDTLNSDHLPSITHVSSRVVLHLMGTKASIREEIFREAVHRLCSSITGDNNRQLQQQCVCTKGHGASVCTSSCGSTRAPRRILLTKEYLSDVTMAFISRRLQEVLVRVSDDMVRGLPDKDLLLSTLDGHCGAALSASRIELFRNTLDAAMAAYDVVFNHFHFWYSYLAMVWEQAATLGNHQRPSLNDRKLTAVIQKHLLSWIVLMELGVYLLSFPHDVCIFDTHFPADYATKHAEVVKLTPILAENITYMLNRSTASVPSSSTIALFYRTAGKMHYSLNNAAQAMRAFQEALSRYQKLSQIYGEQVVATTIAFDLARTHSVLGNYTISTKYFKYAISWHEEYAGPQHMSLADALVQYCVMLQRQHLVEDSTESGDHEAEIIFRRYIKSMLVRSVTIYELYQYPWFHSDYQNALRMLAQYDALM